MRIIDGKKLADEIKREVAAGLVAKKREVRFDAVIVGNNAASEIYVRNKFRACEEVGIKFRLHRLDENTAQADLNTLLDKLSNDGYVDAILLQLPLPEHLSSRDAILHIAKTKDVDGLVAGSPFLPCTAQGVLYAIKSVAPEIGGMTAVVLGRSELVGMPIARLLIKENATVIVCHSMTKDIKKWTKQADIIVSAVGKAKLLTADMVRKGAIVIDVGINRLSGGEICGDVDFQKVLPVASAITPVPKGIGPLTIAFLCRNIYNSVL
ncbi:MAG: bifunctional 5,10-methylenetetrahydrofolate dehydrogenase/5,10-methenyltetrahydrofolate cyclohydrolase [Christensenellaceae bacterium]|jgi:methylenetetrahydrofolate dehydrogenase (NADP+)/methenyltetrahydrofolate cyclohydrolase|nr:bifunctional 5,10-methylenetetrahydrofolate dehydrogenase/5,10-methenyltetrahydrofolate cyclohydrolase [Christensenellaceae bacterium]